jgi:periplasmic protein TonB
MSDFGGLSHCMMDSDAEARDRARRLRRVAFVASVVLEVALLAGMLLWPLITPGKILTRVVWLPPVPYGRKVGSSHPHGNLHPGTPHRGYQPPNGWFFFPPAKLPPHPTSWPGSEPTVPDPGLPDDPCVPRCSPAIPGGSDDSSFIIISPTGSGRGNVTHPATVHRSAVVMAASLIRRVEPAYPAAAIAAHISGQVELRAIIGTDGTMQRLEVLSGNPILALAAVNAVQRWRYKPTQLDGEPVEVETYITVNFVME